MWKHNEFCEEEFSLFTFHTHCIALAVGEGAVVYGSLGQKGRTVLFTEELTF